MGAIRKPSFKRKMAGYMAKRIGSGWENRLVSQCSFYDLDVVRIPDGCKQVAAKRLIRVRTPFDFIVADHYQAAFLDTKTVSKPSFGYTEIDQHQLSNLLKLWNKGHAAGYLIYFRPIDQVIFFNASLLAGIRRGSGLFLPSGLNLGNIDNFNPCLIFDKSPEDGNASIESD